MRKFCGLLLVVVLVAFAAFAQEKMPSFKPEIKRIAVFKNGYVFTYREGETPTQNGWAYTTETPIGVLGTVWGYSQTPNVRVNQLLASQTDNNSTEKVGNVADVLLANEGAKVRITTTTYEKDVPRVLSGTYTLLKPSNPPIPTNSYQENLATNNLSNLTVALQTETGTLIFPASMIQMIEISVQPKTDKPKMSKENRLAIKTEGAKDGQNITLGLAALERGIRWIPAYRVEVKGEPIKEAKLELEASIINELADLKGSEVNFVVGVPSFLFQESISPLSMNSAFAGVSGYFQSGAGGNRRDSYSNAIASQVSYREDEVERTTGSIIRPNDASPTSGIEEQGTSFSAEQLFLYKTDQLDLKKGERASLRLFSLTVPASEVFEWTITDPPQTAQSYQDYNNSNNRLPSLQDLSGKIWYALKLKNTTGMPWTTAPAMSFREWKPLGQNIMTFTPIGGENILRITPATEVIGSHNLEEKERVQKQLTYSGSTYTFDLITVEGTIKLKNIKKTPVEVVLTRNLVGEVLSATDNGAITKEGLNLQAINPNSNIKWNLTIPGGEKEIRYTYKIFVRR